MTAGKVIPIRPEQAGEPAVGEQLSDDAVVAACAVGDTAALGILFDRHHRAVYAFLSRLAGTDRRDLDDFVQTTFLEAMRSAKRYRGDAPVRRWLFAIAANVVSHHVRGEIRRKAFTVKLTTQPVRPATEPGARLERVRSMEEIRRAIDELPHKMKVVFVMSELEEIPGVEIARLLDMREGTVWRLLHQARAALRESLERGDA